MSRNTIKRNQYVHELIDRKGDDASAYTADELDMIRLYNGSGQANNESSDAAFLYEFFTPEWVGLLMWRLAEHYGFDRSQHKALEPSAGNGAILRAGKAEEMGDRITAMEINPYTNAMLRIQFPKATVYSHTMPFETLFLEPNRGRYNAPLKKGLTWEPSYPFDLVIGNPPYGLFSGRHAAYFRKGKRAFKGSQVEFFFLEYGLKLLKPGGLLIFLTSTSLLRTSVKYEQYKRNTILPLADLVDCYRMPDHIYERTESPAEIEVWRRK